MVYSLDGSIVMSCFSPRSMLYEMISLPLLCGSRHDNQIDVAVDCVLMEMMGAGLEGGVTQGVGAENGPAPALLMACVGKQYIGTNERRTEIVLFNDALNTFYLQLHASDIW